MEILSINILKGPNYWSNRRQNLVQMQLDLRALDEIYTDAIKGFLDRLLALIPSLSSHHCSPGVPGGFVQRVQKGTLLGHVIEHVAIELQVLAGMHCGFGRTRFANSKGVYYVVFDFEVESAGIYAGKAAVEIIEKLALQENYLSLDQDIEYLRQIFRREGLGISTKSILDAAKARDIPFTHLEDSAFIMLGYGCRQKIINGSLTSHTSSIGADLTSDKNVTKDILAAAHIPVPHGRVIQNQKQLHPAIRELSFPLTIKPIDGNHGKGVITNIDSRSKAIAAFEKVKKISPEVIVEQFIAGADYRFLVINYQLVAAACRIPPTIIGDGRSTIRELIDAINQDSKRGIDHENILTSVEIDDITKFILAEKKYSLDTVLDAGVELPLKYAANLSSGGTATDVTDIVHPENIAIIERAARLMQLDVCGIDVVAGDIQQPISKTHGAIIEVNAAPGLRMHIAPSKGNSRNVAKNIIDMLYPQNAPARIPIVAVTGTNGKTSTVRLVAFIASQAGHNVGFTTTDGIYINQEKIFAQDCGGPQSARTILRDPLVDFAVLECARGGILRSGLGFDKCSVSILTNIAEDHLGLDGITSLEALARVKSVVPHSTTPEGYAILNADDDLVYKIKDDLCCKIALFSYNADNLRLKQHSANGGIVAYVQHTSIFLQHGQEIHAIAATHELPLTFSGTAICMIKNILAAVLAGYVSHFSIPLISNALKNFIPSADMLPGRMNLFNLGNLQILLDYAHNASAYRELQLYLDTVYGHKKIGIIGTPGDRREEDIKNLGFYAAQMFDEIIIRHDKDGRGRTNEQITRLLQDGIFSFNPNMETKVISDEKAALGFAIQNSRDKTFIVFCPEDVSAAIQYLNALKHNETSQGQIL